MKVGQITAGPAHLAAIEAKAKRYNQGNGHVLSISYSSSAGSTR
jgi:hypothetical protein